jgi:hypothetical protein
VEVIRYCHNPEELMPTSSMYTPLEGWVMEVEDGLVYWKEVEGGGGWTAIVTAVGSTNPPVEVVNVPFSWITSPMSKSMPATRVLHPGRGQGTSEGSER